MGAPGHLGPDLAGAPARAGHVAAGPSRGQVGRPRYLPEPVALLSGHGRDETRRPLVVGRALRLRAARVRAVGRPATGTASTHGTDGLATGGPRRSRWSLMSRSRRRQTWLVALAATAIGGWLGLTAPATSPVGSCSSGCSGSAHS